MFLLLTDRLFFLGGEGGMRGGRGEEKGGGGGREWVRWDPPPNFSHTSPQKSYCTPLLG